MQGESAADGHEGRSVERRLAQWATLSRARQLFEDFRVEQTDPARFYGSLAQDSVTQLSLFADLADADVVDVGGGPGFFADAFRERGARYWALDADAGEMRLHGQTPPPGTVQGSGMALPFRTGSVDICYSSNVAEHVHQPWTMADEMVRITKPGGWIFLSYTLWYGPWGGHETAPWHYAGGQWAAERYRRVHGKDPKNLYGQSLFPITAGAGIRWAQAQSQATVAAIIPRYLPGWAYGLARIPIVREFALWNIAFVLHKKTI